MNIKNREVFYLSGYDPRGARYYHSLYKIWDIVFPW